MDISQKLSQRHVIPLFVLFVMVFFGIALSLIMHGIIARLAKVFDEIV
jgi:hypothetical protein